MTADYTDDADGESVKSASSVVKRLWELVRGVV
jgi:hypothetical protein